MPFSHPILTLAWPSAWAWALLAVLVASAVIFRVRRWLRLRHIPGPPLAGWSKAAWLLRKALGGRFHLDTAEVCEKYGSIVRIGPNELVTNDPDVLRRMSAVRSLYTRSEWYDGARFEPEYDSMFSERDEERHNMLRSKAAMGYSGKDNKYLEKSIDDNIAKLVRLLDSKYTSAAEFKLVDMAEKFQLLTLDIISEIAFGDAFGNLESDKDISSYIKTMEGMLPLIILLGTWPVLAKVFFWKGLRPFMPKDTDADGMGKLMGIGKRVVGERFGPNKKVKQDMIGSLLAHGLSQREVQSETLLQIVAGSDTSATAMRATLLYIITNPAVLSKLLAEISTAQISSPITDAEARKLPYLQAVIKEGMRIFPPVTGFMSKTVPSKGDTINGIFIPGGTTIGWSPFGLMRSEKIWGPDARLFRPERWFEGSAEERQRKEIEVEMCFGYGKYQCLGKNIANIELNKVYVELLRHFEFTLVDPVVPWKSFNAGLFLHSDLWMRVTKRVPSL
ncbi:pisatin demethylase [Stipitochalara longipes BDJ]|nr:pisatin demethylase [Stipitochalara longipes BDJ]